MKIRKQKKVVMEDKRKGQRKVDKKKLSENKKYVCTLYTPLQLLWHTLKSSLLYSLANVTWGTEI